MNKVVNTAKNYNDESEMYLDDDVVIIDWNDQKDAFSKGVRWNEFDQLELTEVFRGGCIVRNFPCIYVQDHHLVDYEFENCAEIIGISSSFYGCTFTTIGSIELENCTVTKCAFNYMRSAYFESFGLSLDDTVVFKCVFNDIWMRNEEYAGYLYGASVLTDCQYVNCFTMRSDKMLFKY